MLFSSCLSTAKQMSRQIISRRLSDVRHFFRDLLLTLVFSTPGFRCFSQTSSRPSWGESKHVLDPDFLLSYHKLASAFVSSTDCAHLLTCHPLRWGPLALPLSWITNLVSSPNRHPDLLDNADLGGRTASRASIRRRLQLQNESSVGDRCRMQASA